MAAPQVLHSNSSRSHFSPSHQQSASPRMYDLPAELSSSQLEAKTILAHLLSKLKEADSPYYARYGKWVERHPRLEDFCLQCIRPPVWTFLQGRWSLDALKAVGGDIRFEGRAVYLNGVLGLDKRVRIYIGQAMYLRQRVAQHLNFRYRRDNPSLHYHAMQQSIYNTIATIAVLPSPAMGNQALPGMDHPELLLNVLEMWMCLVFRTLPTQTLECWLSAPDGVSAARKDGKEGEFGGLNIATPLDHGDTKPRAWLDLTADEHDPLVVQYRDLGARTGGSPAATETQGRRDETANSNLKVKEEEELDSPAARKERYAKLALQHNMAQAQAQNESRGVPAWLVVGGLALALGVMLFNSQGGPRPRPRFR